MIDLTSDVIIYLSNIAQWLDTVPDGKLHYGEFSVSELTVRYENEKLGKFYNDGYQWVFETDDEYWGAGK